MARFFGDLPCANIGGMVHITVSATKLFCGGEWEYRSFWTQNFGRRLKKTNIIYRKIDAVTCPECRALYADILVNETVVVITTPDEPKHLGCSGEVTIDELSNAEG